MSNLIETVNLDVSPEELVQADRVHTSLYTDAKLFDVELEKIFYSTWVWVAHTSEIPDAGSYKSTYIGKQPVIVVRDRKNRYMCCSTVAATVALLFVSTRKARPTVSFARITAGATHSMVRCAAYRTRRATAIAWIRPSSRW